MKTLHVTNRIYPEFNGGNEIHIYDLCHELASAGEKTVIFTQVSDAKIETITTTIRRDGKLKIYSLRLAPLTSKIRLLRSLFSKEYRLVKFFLEVIQKEKPNIVHFHHLMELSPLLLVICRFKGIPHLLDLNDYWFICPGTYLLCRGKIGKCAGSCVWKQPKSIKAVLLAKTKQKSLLRLYGYLKTISHRIFWNLILNHTDTTLIAVSNRVREIHERYHLHGIKIIVKYSGIKVERLFARKIDQKLLRVGYIGALIEAKGVRVLIAAFRKLKRKNVSLTLFGQDGYGGNKLTQMIGDDQRIKLGPAFDHQDLPKILSNLDLLVIPSIYEEAFCLVLSEGLAAHLPLIVSNIGGMAERIVDKKNGFLIKPGSVADLARKLDDILGHYQDVTANLDYSLGQFTLADETKQLRLIYNVLNFKEEQGTVTVLGGPLRGYHLFLAPQKGLFWQDMVLGIYDGFIYDWLKEHFDLTNEVVWDIGAHVGYHSLGFAALVGEKGRVIAFEPNQYNQKRLAKNLDLNPNLVKRIKIIRAALSDKNGTVEFIMSSEVEDTRSSGSHLGGIIPPEKPSVYEGFKNTKVKTYRADTLVARKIVLPPSVIKIDVEGAEELVIRGAEKIISKHKPILFIEVHGILQMYALGKILTKLKYKLELLDSDGGSSSRCFVVATSFKLVQ
ncbi:FkbM family methyltransferase [Candidatus Collierbacteria bacterium]|nr:FkbM family methyltransferase [Candidatus Collierbacteria bacterium]